MLVQKYFLSRSWNTRCPFWWSSVSWACLVKGNCWAKGTEIRFLFLSSKTITSLDGRCLGFSVSSRKRPFIGRSFGWWPTHSSIGVGLGALEKVNISCSLCLIHFTFDLRSILALVWRNLDGSNTWRYSNFLLFLLAKFRAKFWLSKFLFLVIGHLFLLAKFMAKSWLPTFLSLVFARLFLEVGDTNSSLFLERFSALSSLGDLVTETPSPMKLSNADMSKEW